MKRRVQREQSRVERATNSAIDMDDVADGVEGLAKIAFYII